MRSKVSIGQCFFLFRHASEICHLVLLSQTFHQFLLFYFLPMNNALMIKQTKSWCSANQVWPMYVTLVKKKLYIRTLSHQMSEKIVQKKKRNAIPWWANCRRKWPPSSGDKVLAKTCYQLGMWLIRNGCMVWKPFSLSASAWLADW